MTARPLAPAALASRSRLHTAVFAPVAEQGRVAIVEERLGQAITAGVLAPGERLPSESELSTSLRVSVMTVRGALSSLRTRGLLETRRGRRGGSFVSTSSDANEAANSRLLVQRSRVSLSDLALHYRTITVSCAELATARASSDEVRLLLEILERHRSDPAAQWRRAITDVQLELAALSQSARLTREHVTLQSEFMPLLSLQDTDDAARRRTHAALTEQIEATLARDLARGVTCIRDDVQMSLEWLVERRRQLISGAVEVPT